MLQVTSRLSLMLIVYVANTASLFLGFKAAALTLSPSQNVLLLSIHSVSMFVAQVSDLGYSRPAYRNLVQRPELAEQAEYYYGVNFQRFLIMLLCLPVACAFIPVSGQPLVLTLGVLLAVGLSLRSPWLVAATPRVFRAYTFSETIFSALAAAIFAGLILLEYRPTLVVILSILVVARLGPVMLISERLFRHVSHATVVRFDRDIFHESLASLGIKLLLLAAHYSNGFFLVVLFTQSELGLYLQADKLFYAGVGTFAFLSQEVVRLATAGHFKRVQWYILAASSLLISSVATICFWISAPFFLRLVFSETYVAAAEPLRWMLIGFPLMATNMILVNAYVHHRHHDRLIIKCASFAALGNLLTIAAVYYMTRPDVVAFGVLASEGAAFVFLIYAFCKGVHAEGDSAPNAKEHAALLQSSSNTSAVVASSRG